METFAVETYLSRHVEGEPEATIARVEAAARAAEQGGEPVRYVRSIFVPDDESCLLLIESPSVAAVERLLARAGLTSIRVAQAVTVEGAPLPLGRLPAQLPASVEVADGSAVVDDVVDPR